MHILKNKGVRIKKSDKNLIFNFFLQICVLIIFVVFVLFYLNDLLSYDWHKFSVFSLNVDFLLQPYFYIALSVAVLACFLFLVLFFHFCKLYFCQLKHRQALARMILENNWFESESVDGSFFKDVRRKSEKTTYFPRIYYRFKDNHIFINVEITMGRSQEHFLKLDKKIETGFFCEFIEFTSKEPFYEYVFFYDLNQARINISDVVVSKGSIKLMRGFAWRFDKLPHALIVGGTGSGKTYFILTLIKAFVESGAELTIVDPKNADLADLSCVLPNVYYETEDIISCIDVFTNDMLERSSQMKLMPGYKTGGNYADLGLEPHFLIFDEYVAFVEMLDSRSSNRVMSDLKRIAMLGRQAGYFLILACQRPDAKYLADGIRDQFHFRLALGRNSELGYKMMFGETDKQFLTMPSGCGYADYGTNVISQFYAPFVPDGYDFLGEIKKFVKSNHMMTDDMEL